MKKISFDAFLRLRRLVYRNARPLDYTMWKYLFENGSAEDFLGVLAGYQNGDGGFGHNLECNNWNPDSSPYTTCIALDYLDAAEGAESRAGASIVSGILRYLASGAHRLESGWVGMQGIPGNNDHAHMPWFHFDPEKAAEADVGVTKRLSDFVLRYGEADSALYRAAAGLQARYEGCAQVLLEGYPDYDKEQPAPRGQAVVRRGADRRELLLGRAFYRARLKPPEKIRPARFSAARLRRMNAAGASVPA